MTRRNVMAMRSKIFPGERQQDSNNETGKHNQYPKVKQQAAIRLLSHLCTLLRGAAVPTQVRKTMLP